MKLIHKTLVAAALSLAIAHNCPAQNDDPSGENYEWRIRQQTLYGTYIPKDLNEVLLELSKRMDEKSKESFRTMPEEEAPRKLFFSFGRWMTHNWSLYEGSRLSRYFQDMGIHHPDDMVELMMIAYHRSLNQKPLDIKSLLQRQQDKSAARRNRGSELP